MEDNKYVVYQHKNKLNGMQYIGITCRSPEERWGICGNHYRTSPKFYSAITKYGWDNFEHNILETGLSREEACEMEQYYISLYNTRSPDGYNLTTGGDATEMSEEAKRKLSRSMTGNKNGLGKACSADKREKISKAQKGRPLTEEHKQKLRKPKSVTYPCTAERRQKIIDAKQDKKKVYCAETDTIYDSIHECARQLDLHATSVCRVCRGKMKSTGGYHISYVIH